MCRLRWSGPSRARSIARSVSFDNNDGRIRGSRGVAIRRRFLDAYPLCSRCEADGRVVLAEEVDHIKPLAVGGTDSDDNKQALCKACHQKKTTIEQVGNSHAHAFPEWLEPAACPLTIVFGPPGSGKSTYVSQHASARDIVIDLDAIKAELSGLPMYEGGLEWLDRALRLRNTMLGSLKRETRIAWFPVTGMRGDRQWWINKLKPTAVKVLAIPERECIARIRADKRRDKDTQAAHIDVVRAWWAAESGYSVRTARPVLVGEDGWPVDAG